ncbi:Hypothetical protein R9X50_00793000 [Acrodontium crateriforme]|uniref:Fibronectin type-III domain-containing protein n=1 Tax=Acrodontium crateriforme TaxID=150365 RepID=A0AAQ3MC58_9PEZI|nr:Hypothetical protein R9X50_00793000 [Acrodontium crateriforme]
MDSRLGYKVIIDTPSRFLAHSLPLSERAMLVLPTMAVPLALWFKPLCVCLALVWLVYRAYHVLTKPLDELASLLGFDIPLTPSIDLASIKADGAIIHWSLPEKLKQKTTLRYDIHLNGAVIDNVSINESAVTIAGLQPSSFYVVRVALANGNDLASRSQPIRFRTKSASSSDFFVARTDINHADSDLSAETLPIVRHYRGLKDIAPATADTVPMLREGSSLGASRKRSLTGRRSSPSIATVDGPPTINDTAGEGSETIQQLTEKLDNLRRETDEAEKLAKEEEEEELRMKDELVKERDELRAEATEKEKASRNLKREVNTLERQNTAAQNERSKHERLLQQKKQDRQKVKDDTIRWEREAMEMRSDIERMLQEKTSYLERLISEKEDLRAKQAQEAAATRSLDDEVKEKTFEIKRLERAMKNNSPNGTEPEVSLVQQLQQDAEEERNWQIHRLTLQQQYAISVQKLENAKAFHTEQMRYLDNIRAERRRTEELPTYSSSTTQDRPLHRGDSQRSRRGPNGSGDSSNLGGFSNPMSFSGVPGFSAAPFLNIHNGMTVGPTTEMDMSEDDRERLTGGAPMSPGAGADLLPTDLFSDEKPTSGRVMTLPGLGSLPGLPGLPGPSQPNMADQYPTSPNSASSRSPSVFASPLASTHNLHLNSPDHLIDSDRRSIRSTRSNRATSGAATTTTGSRFSGMFGIKQKNKAIAADQGPAFGKAQSHSMPKQDQTLMGLDSMTRKRNSSISGTTFDGASDPAVEQTPAPRRRGFGLFSRDKSDGWPSTFTSFGRRPASPRPGSTHSTELPRPSMDSNRWGVDGWPSGDSGARNSPLAFGPGWATPGTQQSRMYGSRLPSRRPSVQYGTSGPPEDIMEDEDSDALDSRAKHHLAPIGTRPAQGFSKAETNTPVASADDDDEDGTPKLNPAAKDFKSLFNSMRGNKDKSSKADKDKISNPFAAPNPFASPSATSRPREIDHAHDDYSPPQSRKSRDTHSLTTIESSAHNSHDLARTPSHTTSYTNSLDYTPSASIQHPSPLLGASVGSVGSGSVGKESFMAKLTRKSSSGKFSLPTFKREKSRLDPSSASITSTSIASASASPSLSSAPAEDDEDNLSASAGSVQESKDGMRGSGRSWGNVLKRASVATSGSIGKQKRNETPSLSGLSLTSGTGTEEFDEGDKDREG